MAHLPATPLKPRAELWAWALFGYVILVTAFLLYWNAQGGGLVQQWYEDYVGADGQITGSGKWRTEEGKAFQTVALLFGTWVYPAATVAAGLLVRVMFRVRGLPRQLLYLAAAALSLYALYLLHAMGLMRAVSSF